MAGATEEKVEKGPPPHVQEFSIRVPKYSKKKFNIMRFKEVSKIDFKEWKQVKLERENHMKDYKSTAEEMPKFGAGSEFGRDAREEARRKKFGYASKKNDPEDQPWIMRVNGKAGRKYRGVKEGEVSKNTAYYVFTHAPDGAIEAFPLQEWYNFQPILTYKALSAEEAEEEFSKRNKRLNHWHIMTRKRLRPDDESVEDDESDGLKVKKFNKKEKSDLKISEMDDWVDSEDESNSEENEDKDQDDDDDKKKKKKENLKKKKKKRQVDEEAFEESDDGDEEGRECEYMSDSSASESELEQQKEITGVDQTDGLRKLLASDDDEEDEENKNKDPDGDNENDENEKDPNNKNKDKASQDGDKKKDKKKKKKSKSDAKKSKSSSDSSAESDSDSNKTKDKVDKKPNSTQSSRSVTPVPADSMKRPSSNSPDISAAKKMKLENFNSVPTTSYVPGASESGITEEAVRRYLIRKPMTTTELLQKFKKKTGISSEQLVNVMTLILKKINPTKQTVKGKMYLSIKAQPK